MKLAFGILVYVIIGQSFAAFVGWCYRKHNARPMPLKYKALVASTWPLGLVIVVVGGVAVWLRDPLGRKGETDANHRDA